MDLLPITVVDNFFEDPNYIRNRALSLEFNLSANAPGLRTICPPDISEIVTKKILSLLLDVEKRSIETKIEMHFQLTTDKFRSGWVHSDADGKTFFAGVVYLNPNAPLDGGTSIFKPKNKNLVFEKSKSLEEIKQKYYTNNLKYDEIFESAKNQNNNLYYETIEVKNIYNRLVIYPSNEFHKENKLFGTDKENSRLTLVFFVTHISADGLLPLDRMKLVQEFGA